MHITYKILKEGVFDGNREEIGEVVCGDKRVKKGLQKRISTHSHFTVGASEGFGPDQT